MQPKDAEAAAWFAGLLAGHSLRAFHRGVHLGFWLATFACVVAVWLAVHLGWLAVRL